MSKQPPNELESRLHQVVLSSSKKVRLLTRFVGKFLTILQEITAKQEESIIPDPSARQDALNFLLGVGLFKPFEGYEGAYFVQGGDQERVSRVRYRGYFATLLCAYVLAARKT